MNFGRCFLQLTSLNHRDGFLTLHTFTSKNTTKTQVAQVDTRKQATLFMRVNREWCQRSPCCAAHTIFDGAGLTHPLPGGGRAPLPWTFHKVVIMRTLLKNGAGKGSGSVVFIDSDAFFVNASWIPDFTSASPGVHVGAILTPDPPQWHAPINTGLLAVSRSANGVAFLDAWWREIESSSLPFWAGWLVCLPSVSNLCHTMGVCSVYLEIPFHTYSILPCYAHAILLITHAIPNPFSHGVFLSDMYKRKCFCSRT